MTTLPDNRVTLLDAAVDEPAWLNERDVDACMDLLSARGRWLHDVMGITDQWPRDMRDGPGGPHGARTFDRAGQLQHAARCGHLWGIRDVTGRVVASVVVDETPDVDYLEHYPATAPPFREPRTAYVHRMVTDPGMAGLGLGARLLDIATERARFNACVFLRLECSRHNEGLKRYYVRQGFRQVNDVHVAGRFSGALFQKVVSHTRLRQHLPAGHGGL